MRGGVWLVMILVGPMTMLGPALGGGAGVAGTSCELKGRNTSGGVLGIARAGVMVVLGGRLKPKLDISLGVSTSIFCLSSVGRLDFCGVVLGCPGNSRGVARLGLEPECEELFKGVSFGRTFTGVTVGFGIAFTGVDRDAAVVDDEGLSVDDESEAPGFRGAAAAGFNSCEVVCFEEPVADVVEALEGYTLGPGCRGLVGSVVFDAPVEIAGDDVLELCVAPGIAIDGRVEPAEFPDVGRGRPCGVAKATLDEPALGVMVVRWVAADVVGPTGAAAAAADDVHTRLAVVGDVSVGSAGEVVLCRFVAIVVDPVEAVVEVVHGRLVVVAVVSD